MSPDCHNPYLDVPAAQESSLCSGCVDCYAHSLTASCTLSVSTHWKIAPNATSGVAYSQTARIQDALFSRAEACADRAQSWINPSSGFQGLALRMHLRKGSALHRALKWCSTPADHLSATVNLPRAGSSFADSRPTIAFSSLSQALW